ncbi:MAG: hypothetical protein QXM16_03420 [Nitrososphaerota archaeon]
MRVKLRVKAGEKTLETIALANSGYEAETPQLLVPIGFARELGYWPPTPGAETEFETAGGPLKVWVVPGGCNVQATAEDAESPLVEADLVISPLADEILLSDKLIGKLQLSLEDVGEGLWRFRWEPKEKLRKTLPPKYWK